MMRVQYDAVSTYDDPDVDVASDEDSDEYERQMYQQQRLRTYERRNAVSGRETHTLVV